MLRRFRSRYWSHSWLAKQTAKWLGAPARPGSATMEDWAEFEKNQKENFPLQEVIEDTLGRLQNIVLFPRDVWYTIKCYLNNRFRDKIHVLQTGLEKGHFFDYDTRLLHGVFESFVQFIEDEQTMDNLNWELTLVEEFDWMPRDEAKKEPGYGKPSEQAMKAQEKLSLYTWWKVTRPARVDGYELSGYEALSKSLRDEDDDSFGGIFTTAKDDPETEAKRAELFQKWRAIDEAYDNEDTEMLIRLIRIRHSLWT